MVNLTSSSKAPTIPIEIVDTVPRLKDVVNYLGGRGEFAWDHETRALDYAADPTKGALKRLTMKTDLVSFSTPDQAFVIPTGQLMTVQTIPEEAVFRLIKPLMEDNTLKHLGWNASFDMHAQANYGVWVQNYWDVMLMAYLSDENQPNTLKHRCGEINMPLQKFDFKKYWKYRAILRGDIPTPKRGHKPTEEELEEMEDRYLEYAAEDSIATVLLKPVYQQRLEDDDLWDLFEGVRNPCVRTLFRMERRGLPIDGDYLRTQATECKRLMDLAEERVYKTAGKHFSIGSSKQLSELLYSEMCLPVYKQSDKTGAPSTDAKTLAKLAQEGHQIALDVVEWRRLAKLYSTYIGPDASLQKSVYKWGHLHPSYNPSGTKTGRLSSSDPNAQNFPQSNERSFYIRRAFIASPGHSLVGGDYSQIELRIMAHMSQDPEMCREYTKDKAIAEAIALGKALKDEDGNSLYSCSDIHQRTADACNSTRQLAKVINFGLLYGMGYNTLAATLTEANWNACQIDGREWDPIGDNVPPELAKEFRDLFFHTYQGVANYQQVIGDRASAQGYIHTRFGQKRRLPDLFSSDRGMVMAARRQAVNTTIQGHVGELMLHNMNLIERAVKSKRKEIMDAVDCLWDCRYRLFLQVHDEVLGEAPNEYVDQCKTALALIFQRPMTCSESYPFYGYRVPLVFEPCSGKSWEEVH